MTELDALLAGIVANPHGDLPWLVLADWLDEFDDPRRGELLRLHRQLLATCVDPDSHPERAIWHARLNELLATGVEPCVPRRTITLPDDVPLTAAFIPPGTFRMGGGGGGGAFDEQPHTVTLTRGLFVGIHPVTQAQWRAVTGGNPSCFRGDRLPVEQIGWGHARAFCAAVAKASGYGVRLPTEAEWEYAARAGTTTPFYWGTELMNGQANCRHVVPDPEIPGGLRPRTGGTSPVGQFAAAAPHPWGLCDLVGNVREWCEDWYDWEMYDRGPAVDPACRTNNRRQFRDYVVLRGASWDDHPFSCRLSNRHRDVSTRTTDHYGFRVCFPAG